MAKEVVILIADDDPGHVRLVERNLEHAGIRNRVLRFSDGQAVLDFLQGRSPVRAGVQDQPYLLLLDIRMPRLDGVEVLRRVKEDPVLRKMPVIMLTTTDDPREVDRCHLLGCSNYIVKPVDSEKFAAAIGQLGLFITMVEVPVITLPG